MSEDDGLLTLALAFIPLSLMTMGGGSSILGDLQRVAVEHHWLSPTEFLEFFAVSRIAPGPGAMIVTLIGWHVGGFLGALVATFAIFVPSSLLVYAVTSIWNRGNDGLWRLAVARGLAPIAAGLILTSTVLLLEHATGGWIAWLVAIGVGGIMLARRSLSPLLLLSAGTAVFAGLYLAGL